MMISNERLKIMINRHKEFWKRSRDNSFLRSTGIYAPSTPLSLKQPDGRIITQTDKLEANMVDPETLIKEIENCNAYQLDATLAAQGQYLVSVGQGDQIPLSQALVKIPWIEAMLGCPIKMVKGQIWNEHYPGDPEEVIHRGVRFENNPWYQLYLEFIRQLQTHLKERFPVSATTLLRGTCDLAAAIMGVKEACIGWIDKPRFMARLMRVCTDAVLTVIEAGYKVLKPYRNGYPCNWGVWAPEPIIATQADHSTLLSARTYKEQILPYDLEVIQSCPMSIFHIHNCGLQITPLLIEIPELDAIEVFMDPYPTLNKRRLYELKMLKRILAHKPLVLDVHLASVKEGEWLLENLPKRGLFFKAWFDPEVYDTMPIDFPGSEIWLPT